MAKLTLTEEEKKALTFLEWDSESIGEGVKKLALIFQDKNGASTMNFTSAAIAIIYECIKADSELTTIELTKAFRGDCELGNWKVTLEKIDD